ncbi:hypothetical protein LINPERPRIM_LOCUS14766 [Linum perenne]
MGFVSRVNHLYLDQLIQSIGEETCWNKSSTTNKLTRLQATTNPIITPPATSTRASEIDPSPSKERKGSVRVRCLELELLKLW